MILSGLNQYEVPCVSPTTVQCIIDQMMNANREVMVHNSWELLNYWLMSLYNALQITNSLRLYISIEIIQCSAQG